MDDQEEDPFQLVREEGVLQLRTLIKSRLPRSADVVTRYFIELIISH